ncbi:MAG: DUF2752 domain-containing protein [Muribaculaceae bacterium]|nr:DUF2752 domain-containing protein [Muribaculaceae bacterium]
MLPKTAKSNSRWLALFLLPLLFLIYYIFDPASSPWMPQCVFHKLTGLNCMGCGAQRMLHALFHGDIPGAFEANAFLLCSLPLLAFLLFVELNRKRHPGLYKRIHSLPVVVATVILLSAWLIIRNLLGI